MAGRGLVGCGGARPATRDTQMGILPVCSVSNTAHLYHSGILIRDNPK